MISLAIGDMRHNPEYAWLTLAETGMMPGLIGALYDPKSGIGESVEERISLIMRGSQAQIAMFMRRLEEKVGLANRFSDYGIGDAHYLRVSTDPEMNYWYARILCARLEPNANSLHYISGGSLGVDLVFTRADHFDGESVALPLSNSHGGMKTTPLQVDNAADASLDNSFFVDANDLASALPAPVRLEMRNSSSDHTLRDLFVTSFQQGRLETMPQLTWQGEAGTGGSTLNDAGSSGGQFQRLQWSDAGWQGLLAWTITSDNLTLFFGRMVTPIIRLASAHAYDDLQLRLRLKVGGVTLYEGMPVWAEPGCGYVRFPPLRLPSAPLSGVISAQAQSLQLWGKKTVSSAHTLDVDFLQLLPLDSYTHYRGLVNLQEGDWLLDDAFDGSFLGYQDEYELSTHIPIAKGHFIRAEQHARFVVFQTNADELAPIAQSLTFKAWYRPRKRVL